MRMNWGECQPSYETCKGRNKDYIKKRMGGTGIDYGKMMERRLVCRNCAIKNP